MSDSAGIGAFHKWIKLYRRGNGIGACFAEVKFDGRQLSICGVEGPTADGNCRGSCGQCIPDGATIPGDVLAGTVEPYTERLLAVWERWHLNDMRAGCEHQRAEWDTGRSLEVVSYTMTHEAMRERNDAIGKAALAAAQGADPNLAERERALILCADWFKDRHAPVAEGPLAGCFEEKKREKKTAGWVYPAEHPEGLLTKPCPACGHKYGSAWLFEAVPVDVLEFLGGLEDHSEAVPRPWRRS